MQPEKPRFDPTVAEQNAKIDAEKKKQQRAEAERTVNPKEKKVRVRIETSIAGAADPLYDLPEHSYKQGVIISVHPNLAEAWTASGIASYEEVAPATPKKP